MEASRVAFSLRQPSTSRWKSVWASGARGRGWIARQLTLYYGCGAERGTLAARGVTTYAKTELSVARGCRGCIYEKPRGLRILAALPNRGSGKLTRRPPAQTPGSDGEKKAP
ncbi:hypothetical protein L209DRAFT_55292 [Thermothelomyces heterothallicus CBS 203.75]